MKALSMLCKVPVIMQDWVTCDDHCPETCLVINPDFSNVSLSLISFLKNRIPRLRIAAKMKRSRICFLFLWPANFAPFSFSRHTIASIARLKMESLHHPVDTVRR
jgi:hypothetical protein